MLVFGPTEQITGGNIGNWMTINLLNVWVFLKSVNMKLEYLLDISISNFYLLE